MILERNPLIRKSWVNTQNWSSNQVFDRISGLTSRGVLWTANNGAGLCMCHAFITRHEQNYTGNRVNSRNWGIQPIMQENTYLIFGRQDRIFRAGSCNKIEPLLLQVFILFPIDQLPWKDHPIFRSSQILRKSQIVDLSLMIWSCPGMIYQCCWRCVGTGGWRRDFPTCKAWWEI